ncbi:hypothetical protein [uncultured Sanguibacteroides sp.]|uniref:hypothetical protein n=1 Tax=uncultured Sanguibacteroides sp. TaxID=1635151 RepID=UPI0025DEA56C|nr:hypothetical protein [uncultured Sanguibacteroides sp.]
MTREEEILEWFKGACNIEQGVALYLKHGENRRFKALLSLHPVIYQRRLKLLLARFAEVEISDYSGTGREKEGDKFRKMYPFLADRDCPAELKILASDKITTYWTCVELHEKLFSCHKNEECLLVVRELVNAFIEDQTIKRELDYYKQHKGILGEHRIFERLKAIERVRSMGVKELFRKERQLRENIWRIKAEIAKGDKPHLLSYREQRLQEKLDELAMVEKRLNE